MTFPPPQSGHSPQDPYGAAPAAGAAGAGQAPAPGATGPAPGTDLGADLGAALRFAGRALLRNALTLLGAGLLYSVVMAVVIAGAVTGFVMLLINAADAAPSATNEPTAVEILLLIALSLVIMVIAVLFAMLWQSGAARASGVIREGGRPSFGQALIGPGRILATALLVLVITAVGSILLYLPGIIAAVVLMYAIPAAVHGASPVAALKESFALARANLGTTIVAYLVYMVASYLGGLIVIGIIAVTPFAILFQMGLYERLNGRQLPEPAGA
jgi:hypothetical protein